MMFAVLLFGLGGVINMGVNALDRLRGAVDHVVELKYRSRTGAVKRRFVRLDLDVTPEEFLRIVKNPTVQRGLASFEVQKSMGEVDSCVECHAAIVD